MRTLFETDEDEVEGKASEITLSTASLLGFFFGLVLICGVFFGFGYSMGRGTQASGLANLPASNAGEAAETATAENPPAPAATEQEPAPAPVAKAPAPAVKNDAGAVKAPISDSSEDETPAKPAPPKPALSKPAPIPQPAAYLPPTDAPPSASGKPMVQIAAVARPEDAAVLVSALRQRGYGVVVRNEPQDKLLHVQVGPFADRVQATAIKEKLLSDGYNAIIKQ
jgi:DedD protein